VGPAREKGERASSAGGFAPTSGPEGSGRSKLKRAGVSASGPGRGERGCRAIREGRCARALSGPSVGEGEAGLLALAVAGLSARMSWMGFGRVGFWAGLGRGKGWAGLRFSFFWVFFLFPILFYS